MAGRLVELWPKSLCQSCTKDRHTDQNQRVFIHYMSLQIWQKNFGHNSTSLPAMAHFGWNFPYLWRLYFLIYFKKKKILDPHEWPHGGNFKYLLKNDVLKFSPSIGVQYCQREASKLFFVKSSFKLALFNTSTKSVYFLLCGWLYFSSYNPMIQ